MGLWIGVLAALVAIAATLRAKKGEGSNSRFFLLGIVAAIVGLIGYFFLGWRF